MKTIWKFPLDLSHRQDIRLPMGAQILTLQLQGLQPCIWALVDPEAVLERRHIFVFETGKQVPDHDGLQYMGTLQLFHGLRVFHVFEKMPIAS
jgi:hypothetical protein